jgi:hypothetical protein
MTSRVHAKAVWVDLRQLLGSRGGAGIEGIDLDAPCAGGLTEWLRASDGHWIGVVTLVLPMTDGTTRKIEGQLVPEPALRPR